MVLHWCRLSVLKLLVSNHANGVMLKFTQLKNTISTITGAQIESWLPIKDDLSAIDMEALPVNELARRFDDELLKVQSEDAFLEANDFPWIKTIEEHASAIVEETQQLLNVIDSVPAFGDIQEQQRPLSGNGWRVFPFLVYGHRIEWSHLQFPATSEVIGKIPDCMTAMFSILQPGQHLTPHTGPSSAVLRYHLASYIPEPEVCGIRVADETRQWQQGKSLVLNDYREHEAWNRGDLPRVVLFVDFKRPVPDSLTALRDEVISRFSGDAFCHEIIENFDRWIDTHGRAVQRTFSDSLV